MTAQAPDRIAIDGETWDLLSTPLDSLLPRIKHRPFVAPDTANSRGYVAEWSIDSGYLVLVGITATEDVDGEPVELAGAEALGGLRLPLHATWFTGQLRAGSGGIARHVPSGYESRWEREVLLDVHEGRVTERRELTESGAMGSAGPYQLHEPLLAGLSGGAFGQLMTATDRDGTAFVAKVPRPSGGGIGATEVWQDTPEGRRPVHVPTVAFRVGDAGDLAITDAGGELLVEVLRREALLLELDGGVLLPRSYGLWTHDPSGLPVLVMERLAGRPPAKVSDVRAMLAALADAVKRGTFEAHGDVKLEHVFIADDGRVRLCDPAARFDDPSLRGFTPVYNPQAFPGPAADVAACATILRYLPGCAGIGWHWCSDALDTPTPPPWAHSHRDALAALDAELAVGERPPWGWVVPPLPSRQGAFTSALPPSVPSVPADLPTHASSITTAADTARTVLIQLRTLRTIMRFRSADPDPEAMALVNQLVEEAQGLRRDAFLPPEPEPPHEPDRSGRLDP